MIKHDSSCGGARLTDESLCSFTQIFGKELDLLFAVAGTPLFVVNTFRQLVYTNQLFRTCIEQFSLDEILGRRIGEVMQCANSTLSLSGCGTSLNCPGCGFNRALCSVFNEAFPAGDIRLKIRGGHTPETWNMALLRLNDEPYVVCTRSH